MEKDIKRLKACMDHNDYYSMLIYITIIIDKCTGQNKEFLLNLAANIKRGNYEEVNNLLKK